MTEALPVHISRSGLHSLEVPPSFEADGSFDIRLINHSESLHIHLHLDDPLSQVATLDAGNHYIERESERRVRVDIDPDRIDEDSHLGKLKVASAYGAQTRWIDVEITKPDPEANRVQVDESLATPQPSEDPEVSALDRPELLVGALGVLALFLAGTVALVVGDPIVVLGVLVVFGGVVSALFFLLRSDEGL